MELITGLQKPPLHKRYDESDILGSIKNRYKNFYKSILNQVLLLQKDKSFTELCKEYYDHGYKDWIILGAILNLLINEEEVQKKLNPLAMKGPITNRQLSDLVRGVVVDTEKFNKENMDRYIDMCFVTFLKTYNFEVRYPRLGPGLAERFLRERMNLCNLDIPHKPLFDGNCEEWPEGLKD